MGGSSSSGSGSGSGRSSRRRIALLVLGLALSSSTAALAFLARPHLSSGTAGAWASPRRALVGASRSRPPLRLLSSPSPLPATDPASTAASSSSAASSKAAGQPPAAASAAALANGGLQGGETVYRPKGWDREMYRPPDDIMFEWQELLCCLRYMEEKDVNAAMLAPETREMMIGYAETIMARGSPVNTLEGLQNAMMGRWKLAFTTEERYRVLPPATRVFYDIRRDGTMDNIVKFEDKYWDSLVSTARWQLSPQGRLLFEFTNNLVNVNNPFSKGSRFQLPLPRNVGNLGTAFADVSYMDGTMWIEKLRDTATGALYYTIYEYAGPCEGAGASAAGPSP